MTKKDYNIIAEAIAESVDAYAWLFERDPAGDIARMALRDVALSIADTLEADNPRFDRNRFLVACGVR